jgi:HlyD family secretion protein
LKPRSIQVIAMEGKVRSLYVRPIQSADLAFEVPGVIAFQGKASGKGTLLGQEVKALVLEQTIYPLLTNSLAGSQDCDSITDLEEKRECIENKSLFKYDAEALIQELDGALLSTLINGSLRSSLKQAILARANAFLEKYYAIKEVSKFYEDIYKQSSKDKISRIGELVKIAEEKHTELQTKYEKKDVITKYEVTTKSGIEGDPQPDQSTTRVSILPIATRTEQLVTKIEDGKHTTDPVFNAPGLMGSDNKTIVPFNKDTTIGDEPKILSEKSVTTQENRQTTTTNLVDFKHPSRDASIEYQRVQLELQDELLKHQIVSKKVENMKRIMENELRLLDLDINRLQHAFLQTTLVSPIDGVITAVYKDPGDYVNPGEPVIRVENDKELLIVGFIQFRGLLKLKQKVKLTTSLFEGAQEIIEGEIVAIRGHDADDDEWDTIIYCKNDKQIPINYHFDKDNTTIEII